MGDDYTKAAAPLARLTTGNRQLDEILCGGFPPNSLNILMGEPGSGKTILAAHLMFANAEEGGRPILFFTTLSEPLAKVVRYLQQFEFYAESKVVSGSIVYESMGEELAEKGAAVLVPRLKEAITTQKPKIIVIDSFKAIHGLSSSVSEMRRILYELAGLLTAFETTAFFLGEYSADQMSAYPEFAVADGIVELARNKLGTRDERFVRVLKLRGSSYQEGLHAFRITSAGLQAYPRLVSPDAPPEYDVLAERVPTGIAGLDEMLGGGLLRGRSTFLLGPTGSGKTTFGLQFVAEGLRRGETCTYVSFEENPTQLDAQLRALGIAPDEARRRGLHFIYVSPVELRIDSIIATVFNTIRDTDVRRVVFDAVGDLLSAVSDAQRLPDYLYALAQHFAVKGVTSLFHYETVAPGLAERRFSAFADNILLLGIKLKEGRARRTMRIVKARGIEHDLHVHEVCITKSGVEVR
ncbi:MAG: AAA family ATPase [Myxococcota bacterium]|nr:AAA family ATPase [Myxococcota bacterium]